MSNSNPLKDVFSQNSTGRNVLWGIFAAILVGLWAFSTWALIQFWGWGKFLIYAGIGCLIGFIVGIVDAILEAKAEEKKAPKPNPFHVV